MNRREKFLFLLFLFAFLPSALVHAATTIGNNVQVGGTLTVIGASTLTGGFISSASSSIASSLNVSGNLNASSSLFVANSVFSSSSSTIGSTLTISGGVFASSTLQSSGLATLYSGFRSTASSTVSAALTVSGALQASSTFQSTGLETLYAGFINYASSSFTSNVQVAGNLSVSTSLFVSSSIFLGQFSGRPSGFFNVDTFGNINSSGTINFSTSTASTGIINIAGISFLNAYGLNNTFLGTYSGTNGINGGNQTGSGNVGVGWLTLASITTGNDNTGLGGQALQNNTTGIGNTAVGSSALNANTVGQQNVAVGTYSLLSNVSGNGNTGVGWNSLGVSTGTFNTAVGNSALIIATGASSNTAVGYYSLGSDTTGGGNTAIGFQAGFTNTIGASNTYIGNFAGNNGTANLNNSTAIGWNSQVLQSNFISLGGSGIEDSVTVGVGVSPANASGLFNVGPGGDISTSGTLQFASSTNNYLKISNSPFTYSSSSFYATNNPISFISASNTFKFIGNGVGNGTTTIMVTSTSANRGVEYMSRAANGACVIGYIVPSTTVWAGSYAMVWEPCRSGTIAGPTSTIYNSSF